MTFQGKHAAGERDPRLPPGQHDVEGRWPVLHVGTVPEVDVSHWTLTVGGTVETVRTWSLADLTGLPAATYDGPIHCVTRWTRFGLRFTGVSLDTLLEEVGVQPHTSHVLAHSSTGYTSSLTLDEVTDNKAWVVHSVEGSPLPDEHGGPLRLLVPDRYLWKSVKWLTRIDLLESPAEGFWERLGYHRRGDPWAGERYENGPRW